MKFPKMNPFAKPDHNTLALAELADARRELLAAERAKEYAASIVSYNANRIARLEKHLVNV